MADEAIAFRASCGDRPCFLDLSFLAVHTPVQPTAARLEDVGRRPPGELHRDPRCAALLEGTDHQVGRVPAGRACDVPVLGVDLHPTRAELAAWRWQIGARMPRPLDPAR